MDGVYFNRLGQHSSRSPRKHRRVPRREIDDDDDDDDDSGSSPGTEYRRPRRKAKRRSATLSPAGYRYDRLSVPSAPAAHTVRRRSDVSDMDLLAARLLKQSLNGPRSSIRSFSPLPSGALPSFNSHSSCELLNYLLKVLIKDPTCRLSPPPPPAPRKRNVLEEARCSKRCAKRAASRALRNAIRTKWTE